MDPLLSSLFLSAAALILAFENPIYVEFQPHLWETIGVSLAAIALLGWASFRHNWALLFVGAGALLITIAAGAISQPAQVNLPVSAVWPVRLAIVLLVGSAWAFLLRPVSWLRRGLLAFTLPSAALLLVWIVPTIGSQLFGWTGFRPINNKFAPYWLALNNKGELYASDLDGVYVWVFDAQGNPQGTLSPSQAPAVGTPGPMIVPSGLATELNPNGFRPFSGTPTPQPYIPGKLVPRNTIPNFDFCGIAAEGGNLYLVDLFDPTGYKLLRFDLQGNITARWDAPHNFQPTNGCLAADSGYIYLSSIEGAKEGKVYILDHEGTIRRTVDLPYLPLAVSANDAPPLNGSGEKSLLVLGPGKLELIGVSRDRTVITSLVAPPGELQMPVLLLKNGNVLLADHQTVKVVAYDPVEGKVVRQFGEQGAMPGQLGDVGGLAQDGSGYIYIADPVHRVIQRFSPDGEVRAVWWAQTLNGEIEAEGEVR